jgi:CubicO group peptidase (beta-lactamase class C family)
VKVVCIPGKIKDFFVLLHIKKPKIMKFTRLTAFVCVLAVSSLSLYAQQVPQAPYVKEIKKIAAQVQKKWNVPAMALTVVKDGETIYAEGSGTLRAEKGSAGANKYTLFVNASTSKAFTAALMGMMVDRGYVKWTDRVVDHLPDFRLYDPWVTENYLVQDIMNHKTGFQPQAMDVIPALGYGRDDLYRMFRLVKPTYSFRTTYAYCNALYTIAARIVEKYTGLTWEEAIEEYIFKPLEMNHSTTGKDHYFSAENFAYGYRLNKTDNGLKLTPRDDREDSYDWMQAVSPAAFIMCNANDMGQWMKMWLNKGKYGEKQILTEETVDYLFSPQTICSWDQERVVLYAQGWRVEQGVQGKLINHTGLAGGYTAWVVLVPEMNLGVSVLMNQGSTTSPQTAIVRQIIDMYRGVDSDWITKIFEEYMQPPAGRRPRVEKEVVQKLENKVYTGCYFKELFGQATVYEENGDLRLQINDIDALLEHVTGNTFHFHARDESFDMTFVINENTGQAGSFSIDFGDDLGPFVRDYK